MDRRQVEHVETHLLDVGQPQFDVAEGSVPTRVGRGGPRKHLVPGAETGKRWINDDPLRWRPAQAHCPVGIARNLLHQSRIRGRLHPAGVVTRPFELCQAHLDLLPVMARSTLERVLCEARTDLELHLEVLASVGTLSQIASPRPEGVDPCLNRVFVLANPLNAEGREPLIIPAQHHRRHGPVVLAHRPGEKANREFVMAVGENMGFDIDAVSGNALDGHAAVFDSRHDAIDDNAPVTRLRVPGVFARRVAFGHTFHRANSGPPCRPAQATIDNKGETRGEPAAVSALPRTYYHDPGEFHTRL